MGVILYGMLVGDFPFFGDTNKDISDHKSGLSLYGLPMSPQTFA